MVRRTCQHSLSKSVWYVVHMGVRCHKSDDLGGGQALSLPCLNHVPTTTLFEALNVLDGKVIGECHGRHRHQEWLRFLRRLDGEFPPALQLHLVMDNYGTHKEPHVQAWLKRHPRFVCHFVPTSSSWLNLVERWFGELTRKAMRRGSFVSVPDLKQAIEAFMQAWNQSPKPFIWSATVEDILKKIDRARVKMEQIKHGSAQPRGKKKTVDL